MKSSTLTSNNSNASVKRFCARPHRRGAVSSRPREDRVPGGASDPGRQVWRGANRREREKKNQYSIPAGEELQSAREGRCQALPGAIAARQILPGGPRPARFPHRYSPRHGAGRVNLCPARPLPRGHPLREGREPLRQPGWKRTLRRNQPPPERFALRASAKARRDPATAGGNPGIIEEG